MIEVILKKDIRGLGKTNDVVKVKEGYLRNFLIPNNLAVEATTSNLKLLSGIKEKERATRDKEKQLALELAEKLKGHSFNIKKEASEKDLLYGSVTATDIRKSLVEEGYSISEDKILLEEPIKKIGIYEVNVKLHAEIYAKLKIWVVKE